MITTFRIARYALINQGFRPREIDLSTPVPIDVDFLVISDVKKPFSDREMQNYNKFIDRGGNVLILGEPRRQKDMNPLIARFGLEYMDNMLVSPGDLFSEDLITADLTPETSVLSPSFAALASQGYKAVMPSACAIARTGEQTGFELHDLAVTPAKGVWVETDPVDPLNGKSTLDSARGEEEKSYPVATVASRNLDGRNQVIIVTGDSDLFTSKEINAERAGVKAANFNVFNEFMYAMTLGQYPVNVGRIYPDDNEYIASHAAVTGMKVVYKWTIPAVILLLCLFILIRRKKR
jgi:ABC-type uncharacterized transport system.